MVLPSRLMIHTLVVVRPAAVVHGTYGTSWDYGSSATRSTITGWIEQNNRSESFAGARDLIDQDWTLFTNHADVDANDRVEWPASTKAFTVHGPPEPVHSPRGRHHTQATLRIVEG